MEIQVIDVDNPSHVNFILGQSHFIKTAEDLYEAIVQTNSSIKFGLAFCEASGDRLVRTEGNDENLIKLATRNAIKIGAGHSFFIFLENGFPINIMNTIKQVPEVCRIYCATSNPVQILVGKTFQGAGILGVIDGQSPLGVEDETKKKERHEFLRKIGYKR